MFDFLLSLISLVFTFCGFLGYLAILLGILGFVSIGIFLVFSSLWRNVQDFSNNLNKNQNNNPSVSRFNNEHGLATMHLKNQLF